MAEGFTRYCSPGNGWASCLAQQWNCSADEIEDLMAAINIVGGNTKDKAAAFMATLKSRGYKRAKYCEECGA